MVFIMKKINIISRCAVSYRNDKLGNNNLSSLFHSYILVISRNPGISQEELAKQLCVNKSSVTRGISNLEKQGYIERKTDNDDKRVLRVYPTQKMLEVLPNIRKVLKEWNKYLTEDIDEKEISVFQSVLERITEKAKNYMNDRGE